MNALTHQLDQAMFDLANLTPVTQTIGHRFDQSMRRLAACNSTAPPSLEPCRWSKANTTGFFCNSVNNKHDVAIESVKRRPSFVP
jgi:hypothetical protein